MKRVKNEQIRSAVTQYLKRRQYQDSEIHVVTRRDIRKEQTFDLTDMSVRKRVRAGTGVENSVACSSITGDYSSCDQQFSRLRKYILESAGSQSDELSALLFPIFVHIYTDLLLAGHKTAAHKFHERYHEVFHSDQQKDFVRSLRKLESRTELTAAKDIMDFREHKFSVPLSHASVQRLLEYLKTADNMIILQIINSHVNLQVTNTEGKSLELRSDIQPTASDAEAKDSKEREKEKDKEKEKERERDREKERMVKVEEGASQRVAASSEQLRSLKEAIGRVRALPPPLPSICFYTFINAYQGLCTSTISPDSRLISGGFEDSAIRLWRLQPELLPTRPTDCSNSNITLAADELFKEEEERVVNIDSQSQEAITLRAHNGTVYKTCFTPDSRYIFSCCKDTSVRLWDVETRTNVVIYRGHSAPVWDLDFCPTSSHFASSSRDQTVKLWSMDRVFPLRCFVGHTGDIDTVAIHPNGNYVASGSGDRTVRLRSIQDGKCLRLLSGHRQSVLALAFSPNGNLLASSGEDRRVLVWDLGSGSLLKELCGHTESVYTLAFNSSSTLLASGGHDCVIRLWDMRQGGDTSSAFSSAEGHTSPELLGAFPTKSATVSFLRFAQYSLLQAAGAIQ